MPPTYWFSWVLIALALLFALIIAAIPILLWVVAPILIRLRQYTQVVPNWEPIVAEGPTSDRNEFFSAIIQEFCDEGFEVAGRFFSQGAVVKVTTILTLMVNRRTEDTVQVVEVHSRHIRNLAFWVASQFADETSISTGVSRQLSPFPKNPDADSATFPWVKSATIVCEAHRRRLERSGKGNQTRVAPKKGKELEYIARDWTRSNKWYVRCGYYGLREKEGIYRPTWKGAFLMAWKMTPPLKGRLLLRRELDARRLWDSLGMNEWRPHMPAVPAEPAELIEQGGGEGSMPAQLQYEPALAWGEIRRQVVGNTLTIRIGGATKQLFMRRNGGKLVGSLLCLGIIIFLDWYVKSNLPPFAWRHLESSPKFWLSNAVLVVSTASVCWQVYRDWERQKNLTSITVSRRGLAFNNAPGRTREGFIAPEDLESLRVVIAKFGLSGHTYRLIARIAGKVGGITLLYSKNAVVLKELRLAILDAMGIEIPK